MGYVESPTINLAKSDYNLFPKKKKELRDKNFITDDEVKEAVSVYLKGKKKPFFDKDITKVIKRSEKCIHEKK